LIQKSNDKNENRFHYLNNSGRRALATVIGALKKYVPSLQFSPLLVSVLALILHFIDEDEQVYLLGIKLATEISDEKSLKMVESTKKQFHQNYATLRTLASKKLKASNPNNIAIKYNAHLYWSLECLPFHYSICILDLYLSEGYKVLFRTSLLILQLFHNQTRFGNVGKFTHSLPETCKLSRQAFVKKLFAIKLSRAEIFKIREKNQPLSIDTLEKPKDSPDIHKDFIPQDSRILTKIQFCQLYHWLPEINQVETAVREFSSEDHGFSQEFMLANTSSLDQVFFIFKTTTGNVFGAFLNNWSKKKPGGKINGTGECFVFCLEPNVTKYSWSDGNNELFYYIDQSSFVIGGSGDSNNSAISIQANFSDCQFGKSATYGLTSPLFEKKARISEIEVYGYNPN